MRIAYIRVSATDQNEQRQIEEMKKFGADKIYIEKQSGATITHRPVFQEALDFIREQDIWFCCKVKKLIKSFQLIFDFMLRYSLMYSSHESLKSQRDFCLFG